MAQLNPTQKIKTFVPGDPEYRDFCLPWTEDAKPIKVVNCLSNTGDWLHVEIRPVDNDRVLIWLYTDWN